jgi:hypothetical protein
MPNWTIEVDTEYTGLDEDGLVRFADAFERSFGYMGPSCALQDGKLAFTVGVTAATAEQALSFAIFAADAALRETGLEHETAVVVSRVNMESARELVFA